VLGLFLSRELKDCECDNVLRGEVQCVCVCGGGVIYECGAKAERSNSGDNLFLSQFVHQSNAISTWARASTSRTFRPLNCRSYGTDLKFISPWHDYVIFGCWQLLRVNKPELSKQDGSKHSRKGPF
jgi:hypothetical protein